MAWGSFIHDEVPIHLLLFDKERDVSCKGSGQISSVDDGINRQINKEITPSQAFDRDSLEVSLHRSLPDRVLVVEVPHLRDDIQSKCAVGIHIRRIAVYLGAVAQLPEEVVKRRQVGFTNQ